MSTLTIRMQEDRKENFDDAAYRLGFTRMKEGEVKGDISALINQLAQALPNKTTDEIREFLYSRKPQ